MLEHVLRCILNWLEHRLGLFEFDGPLVIPDGSAWLRLAPGESPRWFRSFEAATA